MKSFTSPTSTLRRGPSTTSSGRSRRSGEGGPGGLTMTGFGDQVAEMATAVGRASRTEDGGTAAGGAGSGFLEWVTRLVRSHRGRLYHLAKREGLREED